MCVESSGGKLFDRGQFLGIATAAVATLPGFTRAVADTSQANAGVAVINPPARVTPLSPGNARAAQIAAASPFARARLATVRELALQIGDLPLRTSVLELIANPLPSFAKLYPDDASRIALRDALARDGHVAADAPVSGILPAGTEATARDAPQPFFSTPGSSQGSHHAYPGGLAAHEAFNATIGLAFADTYDRMYFGGTKTLDRDVIVGAALYHDIMKSAVFQWHDDGTLFDELVISGTGAHHILSGAEAIARGRSPRFVIALLSAHAAPSLGDEAKVTAWCRAAATIAGVDPVTYGLVVRDGGAYRLALDFVPMEAFVNHLSDHDYVLSVHAAHVVRTQIVASTRYGKKDAWFTNAVLARTSAIALYHTLSDRGLDAFAREIDAVAQTL